MLFPISLQIDKEIKEWTDRRTERLLNRITRQIETTFSDRMTQRERLIKYREMEYIERALFVEIYGLKLA